MGVSKRDFVKGLGAMVSMLSCPGVFASNPSTIDKPRQGEWRLSHPVSSGNSTLDHYFANGPAFIDLQRGKDRFQIDLLDPEGYRLAAWLLRDIQAGGVVAYPNPEMLRLAAWAQAFLALRSKATVLKVNSGLRTKQTNNRLENAARNSRHLPDATGMFYAMDVEPFGVKKEDFGDLLAHARFGGVGWYSTHIHFDVRDKPAYWGRARR